MPPNCELSRQHSIVVLTEKEVRELAAKQKLAEPFECEDQTVGCLCAGKTRFLVLFVSMICMSMVVANSLSLNFTVICMTKSGHEEPANETWAHERDDFIFSDNQRNWLFSIIAVGTICGAFPFFFMAGRIGIRLSFVLYGCISGLSTLAIPYAVQYGFPYVLAMRFLQGLSLAALWPSTGSITTEWSTTKRSGTYIAILSCHLQIGPVLTMPIAGELCSSPLGWPAVYYFLGAATLLLVSVFALFYRDSPGKHRCVGPTERMVLQKGKIVQIAEENRPKVPFLAIFTDKAVLGCLFTTFGGNLGYQILNQYSAFFLNTVIKFDVKKTGFITALPFLLAIMFKVAAGPISDKMPYFGPRGRVIIFASISHFVMSGAFICLAFVDEHTQLLAQIIFTVAVTFSGLNAMGNIKSLQLISGPFVYVLMATVTLSSSICILILPFIVEFMAPNNTPQEWSQMWICFGSFIILSTLVFNCVAEAEPRPWAMGKKSHSPNKIAPVQIDVAELGQTHKLDEALERRRASFSSSSDEDSGNDSIHDDCADILPQRKRESRKSKKEKADQ
ncbi:unnamed protein product [Bursaphelenchus xylophilus]|uniref:(pine wood nematode) hypothetical protein n=1 Tax=Bursaphelenchus xylophilus TaxID=6326 RepID=A0A1I7S214_BURXY|nr:unnamed protein product [Bursaphelenchus xylophilus]CAG9090276.1 unnamed protein product [Bursaphelenchus xylophilus]